MDDDMSRFMLRGTITNMETGEEHETEHFLFPNDARISAIVRVEKVESYIHEDDSMQISVDCQALDSIADVFDLNMNFTPETTEKKEEILRDLVDGRMFVVEGEYTVLREEGAITIHDAEYHPVDSELARIAEEAFRVNSGGLDGKRGELPLYDHT